MRGRDANATHDSVLKNPFPLPFFVLFTLMSWNAKAQNADSVHKAFSADSAHIWRKTFAKPFLKIENRFSLISKENVNLLGFMGGATFMEKHTLFAGYFFVDPRIKRPFNFEGSGENEYHFIRLNHFVSGYQLVAVNNRWIQCNIPFTIGYGNFKLEVVDGGGNLQNSREGNVWPLSAGLQFIVKPLVWLGASVSGGYRYIGNAPTDDIVLQGWYYSFGVWLEGRHVFRSLRYTARVKKYKRQLLELESGSHR